MIKKIKRLLKKVKRLLKKVKRLLKKVKKAINICLILTISYIFSILPKNNKKITFISDTRVEMGGNLKYMYDYIPNSYIKKTILKKDRRTKRKIKDKINLLYTLSTSKYIFLEDLVQTTSYFHFTKKQELIQLWHGPGAYKKFGYSRLIKNGGDIKSVHRGYKKYTKAIVSGEGIREKYAEAFGISIDKVFATGFLRTDAFFDKKFVENTRKTLLEKYPQFKNKKVILFAPTYRGAPYKNVSAGGAYYDFSKINFDEIYNKLKDDYVFIIKWHPALYNNINNGQIEDVPDLGKYNNFYYDLSQYRDINDLLLITDVLITDYSSVIFDYVLLEKPIIYFTYDLDEYVNDRGLYYPFDDYVYGSVACNTKELIEYIKNPDFCNEERLKFKEKFMSACDGNSTKKTYDLIFKK